MIFMMKFLVVFGFVLGLCSSDIVASVSSELRQDEINFRARRSTDSSSYFFYQQTEYPRDCKEVYDQCEDQSADGVYLIQPEGSPEPFKVYCNNSIDGGGWTIFQRRIDGSVDFYRSWVEYKDGFGFLRGEFWLGNDKISYLTNQKTYELRVDLNNVNGQPFFFKYNIFRISDEGSKYRLVGLGGYTSSSGLSSYDNMGIENRNQSFSTYDQDNDGDVRYSCATYHHSAWWFHFDGCRHDSNLNALYTAGTTNHKTIQWYNLPGSRYNIKYTEMKIRPLQDP